MLGNAALLLRLHAAPHMLLQVTPLLRFGDTRTDNQIHEARRSTGGRQFPTNNRTWQLRDSGTWGSDFNDKLAFSGAIRVPTTRRFHSGGMVERPRRACPFTERIVSRAR
ncbi:hypothetical protein K461DRAFT_281828 [Myriangium duriaei CBS 260.36]|uniref:Uncharacterized protein n=1 Tax=Myriangium duriaei CBS 260.36 TaxID=1168546 RepID=A0A9P4ITL5_9PEZI|nr:hypothetical protein K461DRAFT_281828 [Myriangium duriaei CBS 260.36]